MCLGKYAHPRDPPAPLICRDETSELRRNVRALRRCRTVSTCAEALYSTNPSCRRWPAALTSPQSTATGKTWRQSNRTCRLAHVWTGTRNRTRADIHGRATAAGSRFRYTSSARQLMTNGARWHHDDASTADLAHLRRWPAAMPKYSNEALAGEIIEGVHDSSPLQTPTSCTFSFTPNNPCRAEYPKLPSVRRQNETAAQKPSKPPVLRRHRLRRHFTQTQTLDHNSTCGFFIAVHPWQPSVVENTHMTHLFIYLRIHASHFRHRDSRVHS